MHISHRGQLRASVEFLSALRHQADESSAPRDESIKKQNQHILLRCGKTEMYRQLQIVISVL